MAMQVDNSERDRSVGRFRCEGDACVEAYPEDTQRPFASIRVKSV